MCLELDGLVLMLCGEREAADCGIERVNETLS
jgi:hypothetical protein